MANRSETFTKMETKEKRKSFQEMIDTEHLVLVDFHTEWCGPCKMIKPILEEVKSKVGDAIKIIKIDVDQNVKVAFTHSVTGVPTLILFKYGKVVWRQAGVTATNKLLQVIADHQ